ncbi:Uncharacterized protein APZ42_024786 [Daphnia magna]|uniref:DUF5641 domain-containing protein n=1 Tax=Daphnia magna TaxID=35525 RepID=A0A164TRQ3_9CRUS|nr:Uncharacterized protein APZ42_024786 [Daphnia magna]
MEARSPYGVGYEQCPDEIFADDANFEDENNYPIPTNIGALKEWRKKDCIARTFLTCLKIRSSHPRPSGNAKNRVDIFRQTIPMAGRVLGTHGCMVRTMKDLLWLLRRSNGHACLEYDEQEVSFIETESVVNTRPLTYVAEGSDEPVVNLMAPDATNARLLEMDRQRRKYVSDICECFVMDYLLQIDKFHCKGRPGHKIRVGEVVVIDDDNTRRLMWTVEVSLHPLEPREDQPEDVEFPLTLELESKKEKVPQSVSDADLVEQDEPWSTGSATKHHGSITSSCFDGDSQCSIGVATGLGWTWSGQANQPAPVVATFDPNVGRAALGRDFFFDGATEEKFFEWQAAVQRVSVTEGWNPEQTRQVALRNLRGDAASWHDQVGVNIPDFDDWMNSLKRIFVRALIESS